MQNAFWNALCRQVIAASKTKPGNTQLQYAAAYASDGLGMSDKDMIKAQAAYILSNCGYWRGTEAANVKAKLKEYIA
jgi:hypothetical protein